MSSLRRRLAIAGVFAVLAAGVVAFASAASGVTPPGNVTGLTATPQSATSIKLDWTNPTDTSFAGVHICRATGATAPTMPCTGVNIAKPTATLTDSHQLVPNTQYTYAVFAYNTSGNTASGASVSATTPTVAGPANVTGLTATPQSPTSIKLDWTNPTDATFAGVHICRATGATAPTMPCTGVNVAKPTTTLTDSQALIPNTQYTYAVFAYNTAGSTATGASVSATTPQAPAPGNVTGLTATPTTSIQLNWTNPTDTNFAGVHICRAFGAVAPTMPCAGVNVSKPTATYTDSYQIFAGTQYSYSLFAYNTAGVTASGVTVTTTTPH